MLWWPSDGSLLMAEHCVTVQVFAAPDVTGHTPQTWSAATAYLRGRLQQRFTNRVDVEHVELFSARSFEFPEVLAAIERGSPLPVVVVDGRVVTAGGKLSERIVAQAVEDVLNAEGVGKPV